MKSEKKYALITGAGSGIGRHFAIALLQRGYHVTLAGRTQSKLEETAKISGKQEMALIFPVDITKRDEVAGLFSRIKDAYQRLDLLFNNAGTNATGLLEQISVADWKKVIDTNLSGAFYCTQEAFLIMKEQQPQGGRIINNGSISATVPRPNAAPYNCSKHAITGLTKSTSLEGRKYNIACGQIDIGNTKTDMAAKMEQGVMQADGNIKVEPTFDVSHVTDALLYMAGLPLDTNVQFITVMATKMPFIGRG